MKRHLLLLTGLFLCAISGAQVKIGNNGGTPHASSQLEVESSSRGFLPPRMTTAERNAISSPAPGLQIFNTTTNCINYFDGTLWVELCGSCSPPSPGIPGVISGGAVQCPSSASQSYSVAAVPGADSYTWSVPPGWAIDSGQGTSSILVTSGLPGQNGNISVAAGNYCGVSPSQSLPVSVLSAPAVPTSGAHSATAVSVTWNWNPSAGASGYKWNTSNNYATATDLGNVTTLSQGSLLCNTPYTLYVWAYNACGNSTALGLSATTGSCAVTATGGTVSTYVGNGTNGTNGITYKVHTFTTSGSLSVSTGGSVDVLVVAGGGGGASGGGGGGGVLYQAGYTVTPQSYTVTVGNGGGGGGPGVCCNNRGVNGQNSSFGPGLVAIGGGGGGQWNAPVHDGLAGGSGGGAGAGCPSIVGYGGAPTAGQGYAGGNNNITSGCAPPYAAAGGGGAGGPGQKSSSNAARTLDGWQYAGNGGPGIQNYISGTGNYYGGGGGGGANNGGPIGTGGIGGGANGCNGEPCNAPAGTPNTGGGGGGANGSGGGYGGTGGSGIVIIRYPQ